MATVARSWSVLRTWSWSVPRLELQHSTKLSEARTSEAKPHSFALPPFTELILSTTQHVGQHCFMASGSDCGEGAIVSDVVPHLTRCYHGGSNKVRMLNWRDHRVGVEVDVTSAPLHNDGTAIVMLVSQHLAHLWNTDCFLGTSKRILFKLSVF